jgi:hypothetical protein
MSRQSAHAISIPKQFHKQFPEVERIHLITLGGKALQLSNECHTLPVTALHDFLLHTV